MDNTNDQVRTLAEEILRLLRWGYVSAALELLKLAHGRFPEDQALDRAALEAAKAVDALAREHGIDPDAIAETGVGSDLVNPIIHPAFELRRDLVVFSFAERRVEDGKVKEGIIRVGRTTRVPWLDDSGSPTLSKGASCYFVDTRYQNPPRLEDQWSRSNIDDYLKTRWAPQGPDLYRNLLEAVRRHVDLAERGAYVIVAVWCVLSFTYPAFAAVAYILLVGPKATGKSECLSLMEKLCRCGHTSTATAASMGDLISARRATWLIDQADKLHEALAHDLTASYKHGSKRTVADNEQRGKPHEFEIFGPKAFATHKQLDEDLLDRCIQITMAPATRHVEPILADDDRLDHVRWQLYRFTIKNYRRLYETWAYQHREELGEQLGLEGRELELWFPFEVLFEWLDVPEEDREAARQFYRQSIPNTKAELDERTHALFEALADLAPDADENFEVRSDTLSKTLRDHSGEFCGPSRIGSLLKDHGLVRSKDRPRTDGQRLTIWGINGSRLRHLLEAWEIVSGREAE